MEGSAKDLVLALEGLEREKNIKREDILKTIEDALVSALRKNLGKTAQISAKIDVENGSIQAFQTLNVVEVVTNPEMEIDLEGAKKHLKKPKVGDVVTLTLEVEDFSRIAAQIAKQVLIQKVRGIERDNFYKEFKPREGEVITGSVRRFSDRDIIVDLGKVEQRGPYVFLSRANGKFLEELFKVEVPEINEGIVEIKNIQRDPGFRAKVMVSSIDSKIDPIGTCVGMRGIRIRAVMNELSGERIDLINYSDDISTVIMNALAPAKADFVKIDSLTEKKATVIVPDDQLAIAIGKDWQNIKLASKLTGWNLEVKSESQKAQEGKEASDAVQAVLADVEGIGPKMAEVLQKSGFTSVEQVAELDVEHLSTVQGIGEKTAAKIIEGAKKYLADKQSAQGQEDVNDNQENN